MRIIRLLFYLLILFLPTQLGRHFFFDFTLVSGIRIDYLAPAIYFTDIICILIIILFFLEKKYYLESDNCHCGPDSIRRGNPHSINSIIIFFFLYLLLSVFIVAQNKMLAMYKMAKVVEYLLLGYVIVRIKPDIRKTLEILVFGVFYSSLIAVSQFAAGGTIGSWLYFFGERTFDISTPGIALSDIGGKVFLRPYATFPHPNVLGGFLSVALVMILASLIYWRKKMQVWLKLFFASSFVLGFTVLFLTFSKTAWGAFLAGLVLLCLERKRRVIGKLSDRRFVLYAGIFTFSILAVILPMVFPTTFDNWKQRGELSKKALNIIHSKPVFGTGLNNYIVHAKSSIFTLENLYFLQPVHNLFLLITSELGLIGLGFFIILIIKLMNRLIKTKPVFFIFFIQLLVLASFDHYLFTLQQGQLLLVLLVSMSLTHLRFVRKTH